jgi:hypothetical protein
MHLSRLVPALVLAGACGVLVAPGGTATAAKHSAAKPPPGYTFVSSGDILAADGTQQFGIVSCPRGLVPLSGFAVIHSVSLGATASSSFPSPGGWTVAVNNTSGSPITFEADAVCAQQPKRYAIVSSSFVENPSGSQQAQRVGCPSRSKPLGGGVEASSDSVLVNIKTTVPSGHFWRAVEDNASPDANAIQVFAVCGKLPGYVVVQGDAATNPAGGHTLTFATCRIRQCPSAGAPSRTTVRASQSAPAGWARAAASSSHP